MKIISAGPKDKNMRMQCECCQCVFELESREDFKIDWFYAPHKEREGYDYSTLVPEYIVVCPVCGHEICLGFDKRDVGNSYFSPANSRVAMNRPDWEERYKIKPRRNDEYDS